MGGLVDDDPGDGQGGGRGGGWNIEDVQRPVGLYEHEIVDQRAVGANGLSANPRCAGTEIVLRDGWDERLKGPGEQRLREGATELGASASPMAQPHSPESPKAEQRRDVAQVDVAAVVSFSSESEDGVGASVHPSADSAG